MFTTLAHHFMTPHTFCKHLNIYVAIRRSNTLIGVRQRGQTAASLVVHFVGTRLTGRRTLGIVPLMCQWTLGIVDDWGGRASGCGRAGRRGVTTASTRSRVV